MTASRDGMGTHDDIIYVSASRASYVHSRDPTPSSIPSKVPSRTSYPSIQDLDQQKHRIARGEVLGGRNGGRKR